MKIYSVVDTKRGNLLIKECFGVKQANEQVKFYNSLSPLNKVEKIETGLMLQRKRVNYSDCCPELLHALKGMTESMMDAFLKGSNNSNTLCAISERGDVKRNLITDDYKSMTPLGVKLKSILINYC